MRTINRTNKHARFVHTNFRENFRDDKVVVSAHNLIVWKSTYLNPYLQYRVITEQLATGTHLFKIKTLDNLNNQSGLVQGSVTISSYELPPRFPKYSYVDRHHIKLEWTEPATGEPDNYVIYSNNGSGAIDTNSHFDVLSGSVTNVTYNLPSNGTWKFRIEAYNGGVESSTKFELHVVIPSSSVTPPSVFDKDQKIEALTAENASVGKIYFSFIWIYGNVASYFRLYHDNGTGVVDYSTYEQFTRQNGIVQEFTTQQIYDGKEDKDFLFVVRAVSADGVVETNTIEHSVTLDGVAPDDIEELTIGSTF